MNYSLRSRSQINCSLRSDLRSSLLFIKIKALEKRIKTKIFQHQGIVTREITSYFLWLFCYFVSYSILIKKASRDGIILDRIIIAVIFMVFDFIINFVYYFNYVILNRYAYSFYLFHFTISFLKLLFSLRYARKHSFSRYALYNCYNQNNNYES